MTMHRALRLAFGLVDPSTLRETAACENFIQSMAWATGLDMATIRERFNAYVASQPVPWRECQHGFYYEILRAAAQRAESA